MHPIRRLAIVLLAPVLVMACREGQADVTGNPPSDTPAVMTGTGVEWQGWQIADSPDAGRMEIVSTAPARPGPDLSSGNELLVRRAATDWLAATGRRCQIRSFAEIAPGRYEARYTCP